MRDLDGVFTALSRSKIPSRFRLDTKEGAYLSHKGLDVLMRHAADFLRDRLASAEPHNDGPQTPKRGHPVFIAQHATATCCRGCLAKWYGILAGDELTIDETFHVLSAVRRWLSSNEPTNNGSAIDGLNVTKKRTLLWRMILAHRAAVALENTQLYRGAS